MHHRQRLAFDPCRPRIRTTLLAIGAAAAQFASVHAAPAPDPLQDGATTATQPRPQGSGWYAVPADPVTGKLQASPVLGPVEPDGVMGGTIPSAVPGWKPDRGDAEDAYVYVPGQGWLQGDTRAERQR